MEGAHPRAAVNGVPSHRDVPHLWVTQPMNRLLVDQGAAAYAGAHSDVNDRLEAMACPPPRLSKGSPVDVGVEPEGDIEDLTDRPDQIGARPTLLGSDPDPPFGDLERPERGDAYGLHLLVSQEPDNAAQRLFGIRGSDRHRMAQIVRR
jgi:hypothetical protein